MAGSLFDGDGLDLGAERLRQSEGGAKGFPCAFRAIIGDQNFLEHVSYLAFQARGAWQDGLLALCGFRLDLRTKESFRDQRGRHRTEYDHGYKDAVLRLVDVPVGEAKERGD